MTQNLAQENNDLLSEYVYAAEPNPRHFEMIPHILDFLTYIEEVHEENEKGEKTGVVTFFRKRLKAAHKEVYRIIHKIAGENGACFRTEEYIANFAGCSAETVRDAKDIFTRPFEQLEGKTLMEISEKRAMTTRIEEDGNKKNINKRSVHICKIFSIWRYNNAFIATNKNAVPCAMSQKISQKEAELAIEKMSQPSVIEDVHKSGADPKNRVSSTADPKNRVSLKGSRPEKSGGHKTKENPFVSKKQNTAAKASQLFFMNEDNVEKNFVSQSKAIEWLQRIGLDIKKAEEVIEVYDLNEMICSAIYVQKQMRNPKKPVPSPTGLFLKTLQNKWWKENVA